MALSSDILDGNFRFVPERHGPIGVEGAARFTHTAREEILAYFPQPMAKKSPPALPRTVSFSSSQYMRRMESRQLPVGVSIYAESRPSR